MPDGWQSYLSLREKTRSTKAAKKEATAELKRQREKGRRAAEKSKRMALHRERVKRLLPSLRKMSRAESQRTGIYLIAALAARDSSAEIVMLRVDPNVGRSSWDRCGIWMDRTPTPTTEKTTASHCARLVWNGCCRRITQLSGDPHDYRRSNLEPGVNRRGCDVAATSRKRMERGARERKSQSISRNRVVPLNFNDVGVDESDGSVYVVAKLDLRL